MKIIHCADLHLGSAMDTNLPPLKARERQAEILSAFSRMVDIAKSQGVSAIIIAGDLFDSDNCSVRTRNYVLDVIRSTPRVEFLYLRGNHDNDSVLFSAEGINNLHTFGDEWTYFKYQTGEKDVVITGMELGNSDPSVGLKFNPADINIAVLHGQEVKNTYRDHAEIINLSALKNKNIDYLALGHLHSFRAEKLDERGTYCYCGCLEGRGFDECGEKGFVMLDIVDGIVNYTFCPHAHRHFVEVRADISGLNFFQDIKACVINACAGVSERDIIKLKLEGTYTLDAQKYVDQLKKELEHRFYFVKVADNTRLFIDIKEYENDISLRGEFIRAVKASPLSADEQAEVILLGLKTLSGEEV